MMTHPFLSIPWLLNENNGILFNDENFIDDFGSLKD